MNNSSLTEEKFKLIVGELVAKYRRPQMTQEKLAELTDLHKNTIQNIERGESVPELWTFYKICLTLKIDPDEFFNQI